MAAEAVEEPVGIARLVETAVQTIVLRQKLPEPLAAMALAEVLAEAVVALDETPTRNTQRSTQPFAQGMVVAQGLRAPAAMGLVVLVASTIRQRVVMAAADRVERLPLAEIKRLGHMVAEPGVVNRDTSGSHMPTPTVQ